MGFQEITGKQNCEEKKIRKPLSLSAVETEIMIFGVSIFAFH